MRGARLQRRTEHGTSHGIATDARCDREARGGPAPRLQAGGDHARCRVRRLVRGSARGARLQRCTEHGTSHRITTLARCGREAPWRARTAPPGRRRPRAVPCPSSGAALRAWCATAALHGTRNLARDHDGRTMRTGGPWRARTAPPDRRRPRTVPRPPSGARFRARCALAALHGTRDLAPARDARTVPGPSSGARFRAWCAPAAPHGTRNLARDRDGRTVRTGGPWRARTAPPDRADGTSTARHALSRTTRRTCYGC